MAPEEIQLTTKLIVEAKNQGELEGFQSGRNCMKRRFKEKFFDLVDQLNEFDKIDCNSEERIRFVNEMIEKIN